MLTRSNPCLWLPAVFLVALSLSMGWGIRGNYGHELGAMFPGAIAAIAVCLLSNREDWRERVAYFAFFGAIGWGFGGSISYMQVIGFTHSGHAPTQLYGFIGLFVIGFLWAALGGAGTALPAVIDRKRLTEMFFPIAILLEVWVALYFLMVPASRLVQMTLQLHGVADASGRHEEALYWLDSDWLTVLAVLCTMLLFDLIERREWNALWLPLFAGVGALAGWAAHLLLGTIDVGGMALTDRIYGALVQKQGDLSQFEPAELAVTNWPPLVLIFSHHMGWVMGLVLGVAAYFAWFGKFRMGSSLFVHMAVGWFAGFIALPVLGSMFLGEYGGLRMTPPRGDNWAGVLGTVIGAIIYFLRFDLKPVAWATVVCGTIGGIGFSGIALAKMMLTSFGNPRLSNDPAVKEAWTRWQEFAPENEKALEASLAEMVKSIPSNDAITAWAHWQQANWHSFLEQAYGFVNGIGVAVAIGLLLTRIPRVNNEGPRQKWTEIVALFFTLPLLTWANMVKNVADWTGGERAVYRAMQPVMKMPLFDSIQFSAWGWFMLFFLVASAAFLTLMIAHTRRPLAIVPATWLGRGQLIYFLLLWAFVLGNIGKALSGFGEQRLLTEGVITLNAIVATVLILLLPRDTQEIPLREETRFGRRIVVSLVVCLLLAAAVPYVEYLAVRAVYGDAHAGHSGLNYRLGPKANWQVSPLLRNVQHR